MQTFRFVIQQNIPNTLTYKVISPTRNNFEAVNIVSRDDIWDAVGADILQEKVEAQKREAEEKAKKEAELAAARAAEEERLRKAKEEETQKAAEAQRQLLTPEDLEEVDAGSRILEAYKTAGLDTSSTETLAAIEKQAADAVSPNSNPLSVLGNQTKATAYQTQGPTGTYSHAESPKAPVDISPLATGPNKGLVFVPFSREATLTINKSSIDVSDPQGLNYRVAHLETSDMAGKTISARNLPGYSSTGGIYVTPLSVDPNSPKFSGPHGHFQEAIGTLPAGYRLVPPQLPSYLQEQYRRNHVQYIVLK